jgi:metallophosphoesterase (TIGR03767 family)
VRTLGTQRGAATTLERTLVPSDPGPGGYCTIVPGGGEPHTPRCDLGGTRSTGLVPLCAFVQLSDLHVTDAQSPARAEFLDRHGDGDDPIASIVGRVGLYRPQESLTLHVLEAMIRAVGRIDRGPVTGAPLAFAVTTGDMTDNCQENELSWYLAALDGGASIASDSGNPTRYEGVGAADFYDRRYWHPDGTPSGELEDLPRLKRGYPTVPGLLDAARAPIFSPGLGLDWYAVYGNHDALIGGTLPGLEPLSAFVTGAMKTVALADGADPLALLTANEFAPSVGQWGLATGVTRAVTPDPRRRLSDFAHFRDAHLQSGGTPRGHGLSPDDPRAYYAFSRGPVRFIVLDTVNPAGGWQGSLDETQLAWLEAELVSSHRWYRDHAGRRVAGIGEDRLVVLVSHHPLSTLVNDFGSGRVLANRVTNLLDRFPNVIAWVNGHTHEHRVTPHRRTGGGGWWEITTSSHVDWPQHSRIVELAFDRRGGDLLIASTVLDHAGAIDPRDGELTDPGTLAGWSRELAANPWQGRVGGRPFGRGSVRDRNVLLVVPAPFRIGVR